MYHITEFSLSKRLYRTMVVGGILIWTQVGMSLSAILEAVDAGISPSRLELLFLGAWTLIGVYDVVVLLRLPMPAEGTRVADAPAT